MHDPIPIPISFYRVATPLAEYLHLRTLAFHIHEILLGFAFFSLFDSLVSPYLSSFLFPNTYRGFPPRTRINWNIHVTSFLHSILITSAVVWVLLFDTDRADHDWEARLWGYTGAAGMVEGLTTGYFLWDLKVCLTNLGLFGSLDLIHAVSAVPMAFLGFRPCALYYGMHYMLFEMSTPFANIHWFLNKMNMAGSRLQVYNGFALIVTFACCRLVWGSYLSWVLFSDVWTALNARYVVQTKVTSSPEIMPLVLENYMPWWIAVAFLGSNTALMSLNFFWFGKMTLTVKDRFESLSKTPDTGSVEEKPNGFSEGADKGVDGDVRRRRTRKPAKG